MFDSIWEFFSDALKTVCNSMFELFLSAFQLLDIKKLFEQFSLSSNASDMLNNTSGVTSDAFSVLAYIFQSVMGITMAFGMAFALVFFFASLADKLATEHNFTLDIFVPPFFRLIGTFAIILLINPLISFIFKVGDAFENAVAGIHLTEGGSWDVFENYCLFRTQWTGDKTPFCDTEETIGLGFTLGLLLALLLLVILMFIIGILVSICGAIAIVMRNLEFLVRATGLPIALSLYAEDGFRSNAGRYFKRMLAVSMQIGFMMIIVAIYNSIVMKTIANGFDASASNSFVKIFDSLSVVDLTLHLVGMMITVVAYAIATIALLFKSEQICNDILGV